MSRKLLATTVLATLFASASFAQMADEPTLAPDEGMSPDWSQSINDVFFEDESAGLVRSDQEIEERWQALSAEEQAQVRDDCAAMTADAGGATGTDDLPGGEDTAMDLDGGADTTLESDTMADSGTEPLDADPLDSDTAASEPMDLDSDMSADTGAAPMDSESLDSDMAAGEPDLDSDMSPDSGAAPLDGDPLDSDMAGSDMVDTETTGSTIDDDAGLHAAALQQICTSVESF